MKNTILKSSLSILLILIATLAFSQKKETRDVADFSGVSMGISGDLFLSQGSPQKVVISAKEDQIDEIETVVKNGVLHIKTESRNSNFKDVKIWVTVPDIDKIHLSGSANITAETPVKSKELELRVSGSGKINIEKLEGGILEMSISGSGDLNLGGTADDMDLSISGSGSVNAAQLQVGLCEIRISGSGSCKVDATEKLDARISGSGRITYYSNPQVDASVSGSGKVRKGEK
jgi:hypothetical protein